MQTANGRNIIVTPTGTCIELLYYNSKPLIWKPSVTNAATANICSGTGPNIALRATASE
jgi:hypothetical protein